MHFIVTKENNSYFLHYVKWNNWPPPRSSAEGSSLLSLFQAWNSSSKAKPNDIQVDTQNRHCSQLSESLPVILVPPVVKGEKSHFQGHSLHVVICKILNSSHFQSIIYTKVIIRYCLILNHLYKTSYGNNKASNFLKQNTGRRK